MKCGRLEHGFLRVQCESCHQEQLVAFSCNGVFAPNSKHLAEVTGEANEKQNKSTTESSPDVEESRGKMSWAERLKRVFNIDISVCSHCQGRVRIIACIEESQVIKKILAQINQQGEQRATTVMGGLGIRAPPIDSRPLMNQ